MTWGIGRHRSATVVSAVVARRAGKFFWFGFIIFLTLNLMCFYGVMGVYITPDLIVGTVLSAFFYGFWCGHPGLTQPCKDMQAPATFIATVHNCVIL